MKMVVNRAGDLRDPGWKGEKLVCSWIDRFEVTFPTAELRVPRDSLFHGFFVRLSGVQSQVPARKNEAEGPQGGINGEGGPSWRTVERVWLGYKFVPRNSSSACILRLPLSRRFIESLSVAD